MKSRTESCPIVLEVKALVIPSIKLKRCLPLCMMSDMFSPKNMLKVFAKGEGKDEPSPREQIISKGVEDEKNFRYLKFNEGLSGDIVYAICNNQSQLTMPSTLDHKMTKLWPQSQAHKKLARNTSYNKFIHNLYNFFTTKVHIANCKLEASRMHTIECTSAHHEAQVLYAMWDWVLEVLSLFEVETITTCNKLEGNGDWSL